MKLWLWTEPRRKPHIWRSNLKCSHAVGLITPVFRNRVCCSDREFGEQGWKQVLKQMHNAKRNTYTVDPVMLEDELWMRQSEKQPRSSFFNTLATVPLRRYHRRRAYEYHQDLMYLSMVIWGKSIPWLHNPWPNDSDSTKGWLQVHDSGYMTWR